MVSAIGSAGLEACVLEARTLTIADLDEPTRSAMYRLFSTYYGDTSAERFAEDLAAKDFVILVEDAGRLCGFSSASISDHPIEDMTVRVVFSGDTIMDHRYWGQQALARKWLHEMGMLAHRSVPIRLFWFLIVKGHRTFRYLPAFALHYIPQRSRPEDARLRGIRDDLALKMFGDNYDQATGIIHFKQSHGRLLLPWAKPSERELRLADVAFFQRANPGHATGDELACLAEICRDNMRPLAKRWFDEGFGDG